MRPVDDCARCKPTGSVTIVAISGWGQVEDRRRSDDAGFDAHLVKPVEYQALKALLLKLRTPELATR